MKATRVEGNGRNGAQGAGGLVTCKGYSCFRAWETRRPGGGVGRRAGGGVKGRTLRGLQPETPGPLADKPVETVLRVRKQADNEGHLCSVLCLCSISSHRRGRMG